MKPNVSDYMSVICDYLFYVIRQYEYHSTMPCLYEYKSIIAKRWNNSEDLPTH